MEENQSFLTSQLITYLGNKRTLLTEIEKVIKNLSLNREETSFLDLFSGSGSVSRLARKYSKTIICNDLEYYSKIVNSCYQSNKSEIDLEVLKDKVSKLNNLKPVEGFVSKLYAPKDNNNVKQDERVFYTRENALFLDTVIPEILKEPEPYRTLLLGPIITQASINVNTSGIFKGFHKKDGIGHFGGKGENALTRILRPIKAELPILSNFDGKVSLYQEDASTLVDKLPKVDIAYLDPPYNQHPYGSNYFMLNVLAKYQEPTDISKVSGIPKDWNRSDFNNKSKAKLSLFGIIDKLKADTIIISYNNEGFISKDEFIGFLETKGKLEVVDISYSTYRGSRNLKERSKDVTEYLFVLKKN